MATRERPIDRGRARCRRILEAFGTEFLAARRAAGLSQAAVASASGISRSSIGRLERGRRTDLSMLEAAILASVVGLDLSVRTYPGSAPIRDPGQVKLLQRLCARLGPDWTWQYEVPIDIPSDQRAWDAQAAHEPTGTTIVVEAITRMTDVQATLRQIALKRRDSGAPRVILLLAETRANALVLAAAAQILGAAFPVQTRVALQSLAAGHEPEADALIVL